MLRRLRSAWRELDGDQRLAGLAALALLATMFLPWYQKSAVVEKNLASDNLSAFGVFSFVEAAVFLVALGVFLLLFARGERRAFHLPGGDGTVIFGAGLWAGLLLLWRVFDRPDVEGQGATIGITWGFFFAFLAAAALAAAGWKIRAAHRPEPPLPKADEPPARAAAAPRRRRPVEPGSRQLTLDDAAAPDEAETRRVVERSPRRARGPLRRPDEDGDPRRGGAAPRAPFRPGPRMPFDAEAADDRRAAAPRRDPAPARPALGHSADRLHAQSSNSA